ncbi:MAG: SpoIIE family protein phosphatase, partial [Clostridia bacterium]|nr:SpoIIE family protein phosphatase [Clostridia bacterium]
MCIRDRAYRVTTGIARLSKYDGMVSGDNYTFMSTGDGKYILALSDGMGSGQKAATQSRATISLLEQFMESGFDKDIAVKLINSIFVLKSSDETFSTIDLSVIDLFSGEVEFVKIGAVSTFIKRDDSVDLIKSVSLPVGILSNVELELVHKKVKSGDFIIMMTDGVVDSFKGYEDAEGELRALINGIRSRNPQEIADLIMDEAYKNCNSVPIDDMTVLVAKIWEGI